MEFVWQAARDLEKKASRANDELALLNDVALREGTTTTYSVVSDWVTFGSNFVIKKAAVCVKVVPRASTSTQHKAEEGRRRNRDLQKQKSKTKQP